MTKILRPKTLSAEVLALIESSKRQARPQLTNVRTSYAEFGDTQPGGAIPSAEFQTSISASCTANSTTNIDLYDTGSWSACQIIYYATRDAGYVEGGTLLVINRGATADVTIFSRSPGAGSGLCIQAIAADVSTSTARINVTVDNTSATAVAFSGTITRIY